MKNFVTASSRWNLGFGVFALAAMISPASAAPNAVWFEPITPERLAALPAAEQPAWRDYVSRSEKLAAADRAFLEHEVSVNKLPAITLAPSATVFGVNLDQPTAWFATDDGKRVTANIISYQTPAGGWSKRLNLNQGPRAPGCDFVSEGVGKYRGTFDNEATIAQLRALARAVTETDHAPARASFLRGLAYIFAAQFPNGGWPQNFPLEGGYHDAVTYNDNAMVNVLSFLSDVASGRNEFSWVPGDQRDAAAKSVAQGIACILASQVSVNGKLTAWCQQHDALTLQPCGARNFEPKSLSSAESSAVMNFLMTRAPNSPAIAASIEGCAKWLQATVLHGFVWQATPDRGHRLTRAIDAKPLWARYYEIGTNRPLFGDRDLTIHYDVDEISAERRDGYAWYVTNPARPLSTYEKWRRTNAN